MIRAAQLSALLLAGAQAILLYKGFRFSATANMHTLDDLAAHIRTHTGLPAVAPEDLSIAKATPAEILVLPRQYFDTGPSGVAKDALDTLLTTDTSDLAVDLGRVRDLVEYLLDGLRDEHVARLGIARGSHVRVTVASGTCFVKVPHAPASSSPINLPAAMNAGEHVDAHTDAQSEAGSSDSLSFDDVFSISAAEGRLKGRLMRRPSGSHGLPIDD